MVGAYHVSLQLLANPNGNGKKDPIQRITKMTELAYVMLNREDVFKILALFEFEVESAGSLTCYAKLTYEQLDVLDKNNFGYTIL